MREFQRKRRGHVTVTLSAHRRSGRGGEAALEEAIADHWRISRGVRVYNPIRAPGAGRIQSRSKIGYRKGPTGEIELFVIGKAGIVGPEIPPVVERSQLCAIELPKNRRSEGRQLSDPPV